MDLISINKLIDELQNGEVSLSNVRNLSALYTVKDHLIGNKNYDTVMAELDDILPSYLLYVDIKRKYQLKEIPEQAVISCLQALCTEINEFINKLYASTDMSAERDIIKNTILTLKSTV